MDTFDATALAALADVRALLDDGKLEALLRAGDLLADLVDPDARAPELAGSLADAFIAGLVGSDR